MNFYKILAFVMHVLSFDKLLDVLMYLNESMIYCISAELIFIYQAGSI